MAISLKHNFQSAIADEGDTSLVRPSNWNAEHDLTLATARLIGRTSSGTGSAEEISVGTGLNLSSGSLAVSSTTPQVNSINTFTASQVISVTDNSNPALRITQLGTADALRVEDETSPDSTPFVITAAGHAIAGYGQTLTIETVQTQFQSHTDTFAEGGFGGVDWGNTATGQVNWFGKSRGGSYGTYSVVQSGDTVGDFRFYGSDNAGLIPTARIQVAIDGTPGTNDMPGRISFYTTADGASTVTERMRIDSAGNISISNNAFLSGPASATLQVGGADSASPTAQFIRTQSVLSGTTNTAGAALTIQGSRGTGTGTGGSIIFQTAPAGSSGTSQNAFSNALTIAGSGAATFANSVTTNAAIRLSSNTQNTASLQFGTAGDSIISRAGAGALQFGAADAAAPVAYTLSLQSVVAGTSDTAGADLTIRGSRGTGSGAGGSIIFQTAPSGAAGTAQNAAVERFRFGPAGQLGIGGATYGTSGQVLTSGGASAAPTWSTPTASAAGGMFWENDITLTSNYTITTNKNAMTAGPVTINSGVTVTVPSGSTWTIV